jgi:hypothetical protein
MSIAQLVLDYIQALVWPAVAITAIVLFRSQARGLLDRITSAKVAGTEWSFSEAALEARVSLETVASEAVASTVAEVEGQGENVPPETLEIRSLVVVHGVTHDMLLSEGTRYGWSGLRLSRNLLAFSVEQLTTQIPARQPGTLRETSFADRLDWLVNKSGLPPAWRDACAELEQLFREAEFRDTAPRGGKVEYVDAVWSALETLHRFTPNDPYWSVTDTSS